MIFMFKSDISLNFGMLNKIQIVNMQTTNPCMSDVIKLDLDMFNTGFAVGDALGPFKFTFLPYDLEEVVLWFFVLHRQGGGCRRYPGLRKPEKS